MQALKVALNVTPLFGSVTGVGRYTLDLWSALSSSAEISRLYPLNRGRLISERDLSERLAGIASGGLVPSDVWKSRIRCLPGAYSSHRFVQKMRRWQAKIDRIEETVYHETNFVPLPYRGPTVVTIHDLSHVRFPQYHPRERVRFLDRALPKAITQADRIIAVSDFTMTELVAEYGISRDRIDIVSEPVGQAFYPRAEKEVMAVTAQYGLRPKGYLLSVAALDPRKNMQGLLQAFERLPRSLSERFPLVIAGSPGWRNTKILKQIDRLSRAGLVKYLGYVPDRDLPYLYTGATAFAYPSFYEGFGLPPLEATACGAPGLVSDIPALAETLAGSSVRVDPHDIGAMADGLTNLLEDEALRNRLTETGKRRAAEFTSQRALEGTLSSYRRALG